MITPDKIAPENLGLILCGDEYRHFQIGLKVQKYMRDEVGISRAELIGCAYLESTEILERASKSLKHPGPTNGTV